MLTNFVVLLSAVAAVHAQTQTPTNTPTPVWSSATPTPVWSSATQTPTNTPTPSLYYKEYEFYNNIVNASQSISEIQAVIDAMTDGETLNLESGTYDFADTLNITSAINIRCDSGGCVIDCANEDCINVSGEWLAQSSAIDSGVYSGFNFTNSGSGSCSFDEPHALSANFELTDVTAKVEDGFIKVSQKFPGWTQNRRLVDLLIGDCSYNNILRYDFTDSASSILSPPALRLSSDCAAHVDVGIRYSMAFHCADSEDTTELYSELKFTLHFEMMEYVSMFNATHALRKTTTRNLNTRTKLVTRVDTVDNVTSTIVANFPRADVEARVVRVLLAYNGLRRSRIVIETDLPRPYTVSRYGYLNAYSTKVLRRVYIRNNNSAITTDGFDVSPECTEIFIDGESCIQTIEFETDDACDLSAEYDIKDLHITCAAGSSDNCPLLRDSSNQWLMEPFTITFQLVTNNICDIISVNISDIFDIGIELRAGSGENDEVLDYTLNGTFTLADYLYQTITLNTRNSTGVAIADAAVIHVDRTSSNNCSLLSSWDNYMRNYNDGQGPVTLIQSFESADENALLDINKVAHINLNNQVTVATACAVGSNTFAQVNHTYTVRVDYLDGFVEPLNKTTTGVPGLRRRSVRRDVGDMVIGSTVGIDTSNMPEDVAPLDRAPTRIVLASSDKPEEEGNSMMMIGVAVVLLLLCCCCCCCCLACSAGIVYKRQAAGKKQSSMQQGEYPVDAHSGVYLNTNMHKA